MRWRFILSLLLSIGSLRSGPLAWISKAIPTVAAAQVDHSLWTPASGSLITQTGTLVWNFTAFSARQPRVYTPPLETQSPLQRDIFPPISAEEVKTVTLFGRPARTKDFISVDELDTLNDDARVTSSEGKFEYVVTSQGPIIIVDVLALLDDGENSHQVFYFSISRTSADGSELNSPAFGVAEQPETVFGSDDLDLISAPEPAVASGDASESPTEPGTHQSELDAPTGLDQIEPSHSPAPENTASTSIEENLTGLGTAKPDSSQDDRGGSGDGSLPVGAIVGIAVGAFISLVVIVVLIWLIWRRKRAAAAHHADASTPLATTFPNAAAGRSEEVMTEKEAGQSIVESPQSQVYTDHRPPSSGTTAMATGGSGIGGAPEAPYTGGSSHQRYESQDTEGQPLPQPQPQPASPPREGPARSDTSSPMLNMTVARHLVDPEMTEDEIRRLEDEERELDREIQQASRRK